MAVRRFDSRRSEMLRIYGTPEQFKKLMQENVEKRWHTQEEVDEAVKTYTIEFATAEDADEQ